VVETHHLLAQVVDPVQALLHLDPNQLVAPLVGAPLHLDQTLHQNLVVVPLLLAVPTLHQNPAEVPLLSDQNQGAMDLEGAPLPSDQSQVVVDLEAAPLPSDQSQVAVDLEAAPLPSVQNQAIVDLVEVLHLSVRSQVLVVDLGASPVVALLHLEQTLHQNLVEAHLLLDQSQVVVGPLEALLLLDQSQVLVADQVEALLLLDQSQVLVAQAEVLLHLVQSLVLVDLGGQQLDPLSIAVQPMVSVHLISPLFHVAAPQPITMASTTTEMEETSMAKKRRMVLPLGGMISAMKARSPLELAEQPWLSVPPYFLMPPLGQICRRATV